MSYRLRFRLRMPSKLMILKRWKRLNKRLGPLKSNFISRGDNWSKYNHIRESLEVKRMQACLSRQKFRELITAYTGTKAARMIQLDLDASEIPMIYMKNTIMVNIRNSMMLWATLLISIFHNNLWGSMGSLRFNVQKIAGYTCLLSFKLQVLVIRPKRLQF